MEPNAYILKTDKHMSFYPLTEKGREMAFQKRRESFFMRNTKLQKTWVSDETIKGRLMMVVKGWL